MQRLAEVCEQHQLNNQPADHSTKTFQRELDSIALPKMQWMKIAELSLKDFAATEVNETLGERFKEFASHSAWSVLKATWISTLISKASRSSTQNSDHPQLSHMCRPP